MESVLDNMRKITDAIKDLGLDVYPVLGNHDTHPKSQVPDNTSAILYQEVGDMWEDWLGSQGGDADQQFRDNG